MLNRSDVFSLLLGKEPQLDNDQDHYDEEDKNSALASTSGSIKISTNMNRSQSKATKVVIDEIHHHESENKVFLEDIKEDVVIEVESVPV